MTATTLSRNLSPFPDKHVWLVVDKNYLPGSDKPKVTRVTANSLELCNVEGVFIYIFKHVIEQGDVNTVAIFPFDTVQSITKEQS